MSKTKVIAHNASQAIEIIKACSNEQTDLTVVIEKENTATENSDVRNELLETADKLEKSVLELAEMWGVPTQKG